MSGDQVILKFFRPSKRIRCGKNFWNSASLVVVGCRHLLLVVVFPACQGWTHLSYIFLHPPRNYYVFGLGFSWCLGSYHWKYDGISEGVGKKRSQRGIPEGDPKGDDPATRQLDPLWETKGMTIGEKKWRDTKVGLDAVKTEFTSTSTRFLHRSTSWYQRLSVSALQSKPCNIH